jgi:hypothetical protein
MIKPAAAALLVACLVASNASAKTTKVGPASLDLPPPSGYCELDTRQASDARMLKAIEGMLGSTGNRLLGASADCSQLDDWRRGARPLLDNLAQYQTLMAWENGPLPALPDVTIKEACDHMRAQGDQLVNDMTPDVKARAERVLKTVQVNEMKFLGVIDEEPGVCYAAMLQKFKTEVGTEKTQVTLFATTTVKFKLVYYYLFAPYVGSDTIGDMLQQHKANVERLMAKNPK